MLFLFSDVGEKDAPTGIRVGSHLRVPRLLAPAGEDGMSMLEISRLAESETSDMEETTATGPAGTVYLCYPFLVHAGQPHCDLTLRFLAQPPLHPNEFPTPSWTTSSTHSPAGLPPSTGVLSPRRRISSTRSPCHLPTDSSMPSPPFRPR